MNILSYNPFDVLGNLSLTQWGFVSVGLLIIAEIIYFIFVRTTKRSKEDSILGFTAQYKFASVFLTSCGAFILFIIGGFLDILLPIIGIIGFIALYIGSNYLIAKKYGREETDAEAIQRKREQKLAENNKFKFKVGDKVRICNTNSTYDGEKTTIKSLNNNYVGARYHLSKDTNYVYDESSFKLIRRRRKKK